MLTYRQRDLKYTFKCISNRDATGTDNKSDKASTKKGTFPWGL